MLTADLNYSPAIVRRAAWVYVRKGVGLIGLLALIALPVCATVLAILHPDSLWAGMAAGASLILVTLFVGVYLLHYRRGLAKLERMDGLCAKLQVDDSELRVASAGGSFSIPWRGITALWQFKDVWLLVVGPGQFMTLPVRDLSEEVRAHIAARVRVG